jgi:hypothetical protein
LFEVHASGGHGEHITKSVGASFAEDGQRFIGGYDERNVAMCHRDVDARSAAHKFFPFPKNLFLAQPVNPYNDCAVTAFECWRHAPEPKRISPIESLIPRIRQPTERPLLISELSMPQPVHSIRKQKFTGPNEQTAVADVHNGVGP